MLTAFLAGIVLGLAYCAPVGPVNLEMIRRGMAGGFGPALAVSMGSVIGDAFWAFVALAGTGLVLEAPAARAALGALGVGLLVWLSGAAFRAARRPAELPLGERPTARSGFLVGVSLSMANPFAVAFWLAVSGAMASAGFDVQNRTARNAYFAGIVTGAVVYGVAFSFLAAWSRRFVTPRAARWVNLAGGLVLAGLAVYLAWRVVRLLNG